MVARAPAPSTPPKEPLSVARESGFAPPAPFPAGLPLSAERRIDEIARAQALAELADLACGL
jgi:hypothetical protein